MRKIILLLLSILSIFLIFLITKKDIINYVSLNEQNYNNSYNYNDYLESYLLKKQLLHKNSNYYGNTINELKKDIRNNKTIKNGNREYYLKKELRESNFVVVSVGMKELSYNFDSSNTSSSSIIVENLLNDLDVFFKELTKYAKKDIIYIGLYNPTVNYSSDIDEFFWMLDDEILKICNRYNINYLSIYELVKQNNCINDKTSMIDMNGHILIAREIINFIENKL